MTLQEVLPWWVDWVGPTAFAIVLLLYSLVVPMLVRATLAAGNRPTEHWTRYAARVTDIRASNMIGLGGSLAALGFIPFFSGPHQIIPPTFLTLLGLTVVVTSTIWNSYRNTRKYTVLPVTTFGAYAVRVIRTWWPIAILPTLALVAPPRLASLWMLPWFALVLVATSAWSLRFIVAVQIRIGVLEVASARTSRIADNAARALGIEPPQVWHVNTMTPNAAALPVANTVVVATSAVELLGDDELEAVLLHEMAHLGQSDATGRGWLRYAFVVAVLLLVPLTDLGFLPLIAALGLVWVVAALVSRVGRHMESEADRTAIEHSHETEALGKALLKMYMVGLIPANVRRDRHPPLYDRLVASGITPDFPRDDVHRTTRGGLGMVAGLLVVVALAIVASLHLRDGGTGSHVGIGLSMRPAEALTAVGYAEADGGRYDIALAYLDAAVDEGDVGAEVYRVWALAGAGRCDEARDAQASVRPVISGEELETTSAWLAFCYSQS